MMKSILAVLVVGAIALWAFGIYPFWPVAAVAAMAFGSLIAWKGFGMNYELLDQVERYEFENRTEGGAVQFESFEAAKAHERLRKKGEGKALGAGTALEGCGGLLMVAGVITLLIWLIAVYG